MAASSEGSTIQACHKPAPDKTSGLDGCPEPGVPRSQEDPPGSPPVRTRVPVPVALDPLRNAEENLGQGLSCPCHPLQPQATMMPGCELDVLAQHRPIGDPREVIRRN